ncbi:SpoIID/LytB domain-containing protein [Fibrobacter sp. UBA4309]|uniref:SpoIID/LytB domain-containing protein n=1 Tax=Fibrobacter sp. UBA4309 TaxID=1946537 RepID=UPI0025BA042B|nr:SpoIID/LytB domain-containing protein [Fibrobacter sp. UBA4309]
MNKLIWLCALAISATFAADDGFDLPDLPEKQALPEQEEQAEPAEQPINFAPIEASSVSDKPQADNTDAGIVEKKIPSTLNRPLRVGIITGAKEVFVKSDKEEFHITAAGDKLKVSKGKSKAETVAQKSFKQIGRCTSVAPDKKSLAYSCFPGDIRLTARGGSITAVNTVDVEQYLRGVIPYEIGKLDSDRFSALEAQAIAARTYAYKHYNSRDAMGFDVFADTKDQVYKGLSSATPLTDKAVKETAGIVMTYNGEFIIAYYHSTCGGETETLATWGREDLPYLQSKPDLSPDGTPWCSESSYSAWERKFSDKETVNLIKQNAKEVKSKITNFSEVQSISILDTLPSGRILTLEVCTDKGVFQVIGDKVRWLFKKNGSILPSSFFRIGHDNDGWVIRGKGFGHGVGMCQMGVRARAAAGQDFKTILTHYYPGITLEKFVR